MTAPDYPPLTPSSESRRCTVCSSPLQSLGLKALPTLAWGHQPAGAFALEVFSCAHCGKVEFFSPRQGALG